MRPNSERLFDQTIALTGSGGLRIEKKKALGSVSTLSQEDGQYVIRVDEDLEPAAQMIGLVYQFAQLVDIAALTEGSLAPMVSPVWFQDRIPALVLLLVASGLIDEDHCVSVEAVMKQARALEA